MSYDEWEPDIEWETLTDVQIIQLVYALLPLLLNFLKSVYGNKRSYIHPDENTNLSYKRLFRVITLSLDWSKTHRRYLDNAYKFTNLIENRDEKIKQLPAFEREIVDLGVFVESEFKRLNCDPNKISIPYPVKFVYDNAVVSLSDYVKLKKEKKRLKLLEWKKRSQTIDLNIETGMLQIGLTTKSIEPNNVTIKFLHAVMSRGIVISGYKYIADEVGINANTPDKTNKDLSPEVNDLKKFLLRELKSLGFKQKEVDFLSQSIRAKRGTGYQYIKSV